MSLSVDVKGGLVTFRVAYTGPRGPTDVHVHLGGKDGPALVGYDHFPDGVDPIKGFELQVSEANPTLPRDEHGALKWDTSFTLVWSFETEPREEVDKGGTVVYPSLDEKLGKLVKGVGEFFKRRDGCFIATAAFGSPLEHEVVRLRDWRDRVLRPTRTGRFAIALYALASPPLARVIARRREGVIGSLTRVALRALLAAIDRAK